MIGTQTLTQHPAPRHAPLASHPAFTPVFILWCAALLGLPVVAVSGASLESWATSARLDLVLPAAAPPLGTTARLLLMVGFGVLGAGIGWVIARYLRPTPVRDGDEIQLRARDRHPDAPARRPISAHAELGDEGLGSVSVERDLFPDDLSAYRTLPEEAPRHGGYAYEHTPVFTTQPLAPQVPVFAPAAEPVAPTLHHQPAPHQDADAYDMPDIDFDGLGSGLHAPYPSPMAQEAQPATAPVPTPTEDDWHGLPPVVSDTDLHRAPVRSLTPVVSIAPIAPALRAVEKPVPTEAPALIGATPVQPRASASERIAHAALGDLSHVELIERLAMAIHSRDKSVTPVAVNDAQDGDFGAAPADENEGLPSTQAILRSALAGLREVK